MHPTLVREPFARAGWVYEEKFAGWRVLAYKSGSNVRLISRRGVDHTSRFQDVARAVAQLPVPTLILDGELCAFDRNLVSHINLLDAGPDEIATPPVLIAFDIVHARGGDVRDRALSYRRSVLEDAIAGSARVSRASSRRRWP